MAGVPLALVARIRRSWRRSLQLRVVATTFLLAAGVVLILGVVLVHQIGQGLLDAKVRAARAEAGYGLNYFQNTLSSLPATEDLRETLVSQVQRLSDRGSPAGLYSVVLLGTALGSLDYAAAPGFGQGDVPRRLRETITRERVQAYTYAPVRSGGEDWLIVGGPLVAPSDTFQLYYLFPLDQERQTLGLVTRIITAGGVVLVGLLVLIAAALSRQVVRPVRSAARTAERLSAGQLAERMQVRGEDDLARLATSFNSMAANLQQQIRQLEELSVVQRRFVADVSHELRTPLTTVRMATDLLYDARATFPPEVSRAAELLQKELERFESLLADLLEISRFDAQAVNLETETVDVTELVRDVVEGMRALAVSKGCDLDTSGVPASQVLAQLDPRRVQRVLRNLINNAFEYAAGAPIEIAVAADADAVAVTVRDHGPGFGPEDASRLFDRFWRADISRARRSGGTGLGLSIAVEDTRLHGGWLEAWGRPEEGAQFRLTLPRRVDSRLHGSPLALEPTGTVAAGSEDTVPTAPSRRPGPVVPSPGSPSGSTERDRAPSTGPGGGR